MNDHLTPDPLSIESVRPSVRVRRGKKEKRHARQTCCGAGSGAGGSRPARSPVVTGWPTAELPADLKQGITCDLES